MTDKEIIRAEIERCENICNEFIITHTNTIELGIAKVKKRICQHLKSFVDSLPEKQIWHEGNEEPKDNSKAIVCQTNDNSKTVLTMEYHKSDKLFHIKSPLGNDYPVGLNYPHLRWAYPEDLLPNK